MKQKKWSPIQIQEALSLSKKVNYSIEDIDVRSFNKSKKILNTNKIMTYSEFQKLKKENLRIGCDSVVWNGTTYEKYGNTTTIICIQHPRFHCINILMERFFNV